MIRRFGHPVDPERTVAALGCMDRIKDRTRKRAKKTKEARELKKLGKDAIGEWQRYVDLKKGEVFYINTHTQERRAKIPVGGRRSMADGIEMMSNPAKGGGGDATARSVDGTMNDGLDQSEDAGVENDTENKEDDDADEEDEPEYVLDSAGFGRLQRALETQRIKIAVVTTLVIIVYFMYMRVTRSLIEVYSVQQIDDTPYLARSLDKRANTPIHINFQIAAAFWLVGFTIGMPIIGFSVVTWMFRTGRENDPRWRTAFGFLNDGYKREYYWWEGAVLLRKLALLLVAVVLSPNDGFLQAFSAVCVLSIAMGVQTFVQPYESTLINILDMTAMAAVYSTRLGAILFSHFDPKEKNLEECRGGMLGLGWDLNCKDGRDALGAVIGYLLISIQAVLVTLFVAAMFTEKISESGIVRKVKDFLATKCTCCGGGKGKDGGEAKPGEPPALGAGPPPDDSEFFGDQEDRRLSMNPLRSDSLLDNAAEHANPGGSGEGDSILRRCDAATHDAFAAQLAIFGGDGYGSGSDSNSNSDSGGSSSSSSSSSGAESNGDEVQFHTNPSLHNMVATAAPEEGGSSITMFANPGDVRTSQANRSTVRSVDIHVARALDTSSGSSAASSSSSDEENGI